jgi:hypothetical protein
MQHQQGRLVAANENSFGDLQLQRFAARPEAASAATIFNASVPLLN